MKTYGWLLAIIFTLLAIGSMMFAWKMVYKLSEIWGMVK